MLDIEATIAMLRERCGGPAERLLFDLGYLAGVAASQRPPNQPAPVSTTITLGDGWDTESTADRAKRFARAEKAAKKKDPR